MGEKLQAVHTHNSNTAPCFRFNWFHRISMFVWSASLRWEMDTAANWQDTSVQYCFKRWCEVVHYRYCIAAIFNQHSEMHLEGCKKVTRKMLIYIVQQCTCKTSERMQFQWKVFRESSNWIKNIQSHFWMHTCINPEATSNTCVCARVYTYIHMYNI